MGTVLKLATNRVRVFAERLDVAAGWDRDRLGEAERAVERAASAVSKLGTAPINHQWVGALGGRLTPFDAERLERALEEGSRCGTTFSQQVAKPRRFWRVNPIY